ncbi:MAG: hypothetical protein EOP11_15760 [Proteobacteria bacterium]|nr:MAG: hypothetical protein EOP11_15760 [Pseudomonadota bacterium]
MILSLTRLRVRRWLDLPRFLWSSRASVAQAKGNPKCLAGATYSGPGLIFWTATIWDDEPAMLAYVRTPPHGPWMRYLKVWCSEAATAHMPATSTTLPAMEKLPGLLRSRVKFIPVKWPAMDHEQKWIPPAEPTRMQPFR